MAERVDGNFDHNQYRSSPWLFDYEKSEDTPVSIWSQIIDGLPNGDISEEHFSAVDNVSLKQAQDMFLKMVTYTVTHETSKFTPDQWLKRYRRPHIQNCQPYLSPTYLGSDGLARFFDWSKAVGTHLYQVYPLWTAYHREITQRTDLWNRWGSLI